jgi:RimJ/RimL family protein N-acetyltransferase
MTGPTIHTQRLTIRPLQTADAGFLLRLMNDPDFIRFIGDRGVRTADEARAYIEDQIARYRGTPWCLFVVRHIDNQQPVGVCSFRQRKELTDPDIGFAFLPEFRRQGYAFEATSATLAHLQQTPGIRRIVAIVSADNERSIALLEKLGYRVEGPVQADSCGDLCTLLYVPVEPAG